MTQEQGWDERAGDVEGPTRYAVGDAVRYRRAGQGTGEILSEVRRGGQEGYAINPDNGAGQVWVPRGDVLGYAAPPQVDDALAVMRQTGTRDTHVRLLASQLLWLVAREVNPASTRSARAAACDMRREVYALLEAQIAEVNGRVGAVDGERITSYEATIRFGETLGGIRLAMDVYSSPQDMPQEAYDAIRDRLRMLAALEALIYHAGATNPDFPHVMGTVIVP